MTKLIAFIIGLYVAFKFYKVFADYLIVVWNLDGMMQPLVKPALSFLHPARESNTIMLNSDNINIYISHHLIGIISFILLFLATYFFIKLCGRLLNGIFNGGILAPANRLGGFIIGAVRGLLLVLLLMIILIPLQAPIGLVGGETALMQAVNQSSLGKFLWQIISSAELKLN